MEKGGEGRKRKGGAVRIRKENGGEGRRKGEERGGGRWRGRRRGGGAVESLWGQIYTSKLERVITRRRRRSEQRRHKITSLQPDTKLKKINKLIYSRLHPGREMTPIELEFVFFFFL